MRDLFADVRRAGFDIGLSAGKLAKAMVEVLSQLPAGSKISKEVVVRHLGLLGQMSKSRDLDTAWDKAKRQAARELPGRFWLDGRILRWESERADLPREKLSAAGRRRLEDLAAREGVSPDALLAALIRSWRGARKGATGER